MAYEIPIFMLGTEIAHGDLRTKQYYAMKDDSTGITIATVAGEPIDGVLQNKPNDAAAAEVMCLGVTKAVAGAAISKGAKVMADSTGKFITAATTGSTIIGKALTAAGADGDIFSLLLLPGMGTV